MQICVMVSVENAYSEILNLVSHHRQTNANVS